MQKITKKEIEDAYEELKLASIAILEIDEKVEKVQLERQKARKRLSLARDAVYGLKLI